MTTPKKTTKQQDGRLKMLPGNSIMHALWHDCRATIIDEARARKIPDRAILNWIWAIEQASAQHCGSCGR